MWIYTHERKQCTDVHTLVQSVIVSRELGAWTNDECTVYTKWLECVYRYLFIAAIIVGIVAKISIYENIVRIWCQQTETSISCNDVRALCKQCKKKYEATNLRTYAHALKYLNCLAMNATVFAKNVIRCCI